MRFAEYLIGKKSRQKMTNFFASDEFFDRLFFYRRLIFTDKYSYRHFFTNENI